jgi:hypothetical protein
MIHLQFAILAMFIAVIIVCSILNDEVRAFVLWVLLLILSVGILVAVIWSANGVWDYYAQPNCNIPAQVEREGKGTQ